MKVVWTTDAKDTYEQNIAYLANEWDEAVTGNFIEKNRRSCVLYSEEPGTLPILK